ncbi:uncharacterized protein J8A68_005225 [[Candida] subhashii]|uniref:Zn(2)-C6 fungal-type domain-containing protein n=1 Tax=[Candida] subhashii TaxID=561895 RepID=A0A8J5Q3P7_9ASCO|nr:uncharacterized protein J8A68_005225 [[Candida] subhashii]KAG7661229.1 hypothetical protein J8A68_005225 [[Candida] subhashii]
MTKQKRGRLILSCDNCYSRKLKCDRQSPCLSCVRQETECTYSKAAERKNLVKKSDSIIKQSVSTSATNVFQQIEVIKNQIVELESTLRSNAPPSVNGLVENCQSGVSPISSSAIDEINYDRSFVPGEDGPLMLAHRPFPYMQLCRRDLGAKGSWLQMIRVLKERMNFLETSITIDDLSDEKKADLSMKAKLIYDEGYIPSDEECQLIPFNQLKEIINKSGLSKGITFVPDANIFDPMTSYFQLIPPSWVNDKLLDIFFHDIYPHLPIIDENDFRSDLDRIIPTDFQGNYLHSVPKVESSYDLAILVIHLVILRVAYLSLLNINRSSSGSELVMYPVSLDAIRAAEVIMKEFDLAKRQPLVVIQAGLLFRLYLNLSPENLFSGSTTQSSMGAIIQLAFSLGLNRDPIHMNVTSIKEQILRRKVWHFLVRIDILNSILFNTTITTDPMNSDVSLPELSEVFSNSRNIKLEQDIIDSFHKFQSLLLICYKLAKIHLSVNESFNITEIISLLSQLEHDENLESKTIVELLNGDNFMDLFTCRMFIRIKLYCFYNYYLLYLYYEAKGNCTLQSYYFGKSLQILLADLNDLSTNLIQRDDSYKFSIFIIPILHIYIHLLFMTFIPFKNRLSCSIVELTKNPTSFDKSQGESLESFTKCLIDCSESIRFFLLNRVKVLGELAESYMYSLHISHVYSNCMKLYENRMKSNQESSIKIPMIKLSQIEIEKLTQLIRRNLHYNNVNEKDIWTGSDEEIIREMQTENFWYQFRRITTEEMVTSSWIEKSKNFNKTDFGFNFNLELFESFLQDDAFQVK